MNRTHRLLIAACCSFGLLLAACGGGDVCSDKGKCSDTNTAPSQAQVDACKAIIGDSSCGSKAQTYFQCAEDHETCATDGTSAGPGTACDNQFNDYAQCCQDNPSGPACQG